jgi:hypothetical protein
MRTVNVNRMETEVGQGSTGVPVAGSTPQSAAVSTAFAQPLAVVVTDGGGNPLQNVVVMYTVPGSGASATLSSPTAVTNTTGTASVTATANATAGTYVITAGVMGLVQPVVFNLTNT